MNTKAFALVRIAFGFVWAADAWFKWQPAFSAGFVGYFTDALESQPPIIAAWIQGWIHLVSAQPAAWALLIACLETAIALALIFGFCTRVAIVGGAALAFLIWAVPEGFGMVFMPGMTDIGAGIIYVFVFAMLWLGESWKAYSVDSWRASILKH